MPYFTHMPGVKIDLAGDPPQAVVSAGSGRADFAHLLDQSTGFAALVADDSEADTILRGTPVSLSGAEGAAPPGAAVYAGAGTLQTALTFVGIAVDEAAFAVHPIPGHFLLAGEPGAQSVYFVTEFPLDAWNVGFDISLLLPPGQELTDVKIAEIGTTPPLDQPQWALLRGALTNFGALGIALGYDPDGVYALDEATPCFAAGTLIATDRGPRPVETLAAGDLILTADHGLRRLRWVGRVALAAARLREAPGLRPIRLRAGALGAGQPSADLLVSPQHRVLVRSPAAARMFGAAEVLVAARQLLTLPGIEVAAPQGEVVYVHLLFDRHELVWSNGALTESLYTGPQALRALGAVARREILTLFPQLRRQPPPPARVLVPGRRGRRLAGRHLKNRRPLLA